MNSVMFSQLRSLAFDHGFLVFERNDEKFHLFDRNHHSNVFSTDDLEQLVVEIELNTDEKSAELIAWLDRFWKQAFAKTKAGATND